MAKTRTVTTSQSLAFVAFAASSDLVFSMTGLRSIFEHFHSRYLMTVLYIPGESR